MVQLCVGSGLLCSALHQRDWRLETGLDCPVSLAYDQHEQAREHEGREAREARGEEKGGRKGAKLVSGSMAVSERVLG